MRRDFRPWSRLSGGRTLGDMVSDPMTGDVVVGVDGSAPSSTALAWALAEARRREADLRIVRVFSPVEPYRDARVAGDIEAEAQAQFQKVLAGEPPGVAVKVEAVAGGPAGELLAAARGAGALVVGTRGLGGFAQLVVGSVSQQCVRHSPVPVVVVREPPDPAGRIVVGVDGSPDSMAALRWALAEARLAGAEVEAVLAWTYPAAFRHGQPVFPYEAMLAGATHELEAALRDAGPDAAGLPLHSSVVEGHAAAALVEASRAAALLVVGSRGRGGFAGLLLGSVSETCLHHAAGPVAVVRERSGS